MKESRKEYSVYFLIGDKVVCQGTKKVNPEFVHLEDNVSAVYLLKPSQTVSKRDIIKAGSFKNLVENFALFKITHKNIWQKLIISERAS